MKPTQLALKPSRLLAYILAMVSFFAFVLVMPQLTVINMHTKRQHWSRNIFL
jgi:hypothetical protein